MKRKILSCCFLLSSLAFVTLINNPTVVKADNLQPTLKEETIYLEDFSSYEAGQDSEDVYSIGGLLWTNDAVFGEIDENGQLVYEVQNVDSDGYSRIGAFGTKTTNNLDKLVPGQKYTFSVKLDLSEIKENGAIFFEYFNKDWTGVKIYSNYDVEILGNASNGKYKNGVLSFDFIANTKGHAEGAEDYPYIKLTGQNLDIGDKIIVDDFKIVRNRLDYVLDNDFETMTVESDIAKTNNFWNNSMTSIKVAKEDNNNKYVELIKNGTDGVQQWGEYYLNKLSVTDKHDYRLEFDVVGDGWDEFYIRYNDNVYDCITYRKDHTLDIPEYQYFLGSTYEGSHVVYDFKVSSDVNSNFYNQVFFVVRNSGQITFGMDNISIQEINTGSSATLQADELTLKLKDNKFPEDYSASLVYGEDDVRKVSLDELVIDDTNLDINSVGTYSLAVYVVDEKLQKYEANLTVKVEDYLKKIQVVDVKDTYKYGEDLDLTDAKLKLIMASAAEEEKTLELGYITGYNKNTLGEQTLTVLYQNIETTFKVTVEDYLVDLELTLPSKLTYQVGDSFDNTGLVVKKVMASGEKVETTEMSLTGFDSTSVVNKTVTVKVGDKEQTFEVEIVAKQEEVSEPKQSEEAKTEEAKSAEEKPTPESKKGCKGMTSGFATLSLLVSLLFLKRKNKK